MQTLASRCPDSVFGREHECEKLYALLEQEPSSIQVILGPMNCGKTKLLYAIAQQEKHDSCIAYLNGRSDIFYSPQGLARTLALRLLKLVALLPKSTWNAALRASNQSDLLTLLKGFLQTGLHNWTLTSKQDEVPRIELLQLFDKMSTADALHLVEWQARNMPPTLQMLFEVSTQLLTAWRSTRAVDKPEGLQWPVLVIDYANLLMDWTDEHPAELSQLLKYLKQLTKYKLCHLLIVVSSEHCFTQWLQDRTGECYLVYV
jgi:ATPase domain predominantly from Archaea